MDESSVSIVLLVTGLVTLTVWLGSLAVSHELRQPVGKVGDDVQDVPPAH